MAIPQQPGFVIRQNFPRPSAEVVARFSAFTSANLSDAMGKANTLDYRIKALQQPAPRLLGTALTVKARPGDNLMAMKAIGLAQPGDVIVIAGGYDTNYAIWGGVMSLMAQSRAIAGVVTDGVVRDSDHMREIGFTVYAAGLTPVGPSKDGRGQIGMPVACGGIIIHPGDIVVGDSDGVVIIPQAEADSVYARVQARIDLEAKWIDGIARGDLMLIDSDESLVARGCQFI